MANCALLQNMHTISSVVLDQSSSVAQSCPALRDSHFASAARQASLSITNSGACSNSCPSSQWCHPTISSCRPLLLPPAIFPSIRVFSNESVLCNRLPKHWSFSFSISPSNEYSGLTSFRIDWFDPLTVKGLSRVFSNTTVQNHQFFGTPLSLWSNSHYHTWLLEKP